MGDAEKWVRDALESGKRIMGFGHRVYRAEDPRSRVLKRTAKELGAPNIEIAEELEAVALRVLQERHPERVLATNVEYYSAVVLDVAEIPPPLAPAMFACSRVAGWSAHILEQKRTGRLFRPSARYVGPAPRSLQTRLTLAEAAAQAEELAECGRREGARDAAAPVGRRARDGGARPRLPRPRAGLPRDRAVPLPPEDGAAPARARGRQPGVPRLGARGARVALARPPRRRQPGAAEAALARERGRQRGGAAARDRLPEERLAAARTRSACCGASRTTTSRRASCARPPRRSRSCSARSPARRARKF